MSGITSRTPVSEQEARELYRAEVARRAEAKAARKAARAASAPSTTGPVRLQSGRLSARNLSCLCGCGEPTKQREARFISGHDARLRAALRSAGLDASAIPEIARPFFEDGPIAGLMLVRSDEGEQLVDVKEGGWA